MCMPAHRHRHGNSWCANCTYIRPASCEAALSDPHCSFPQQHHRHCLPLPTAAATYHYPELRQSQEAQPRGPPQQTNTEYPRTKGTPFPGWLRKLTVRMHPVDIEAAASGRVHFFFPFGPSNCLSDCFLLVLFPLRVVPDAIFLCVTLQALLAKMQCGP